MKKKYWIRKTEAKRRVYWQVREFDDSYPYPPPATKTTSNWLYGPWVLVQELIQE